MAIITAVLLVAASVHAAIYTHDALSGFVTETNPNGETIEYHYDAVNRLSKVVLARRPQDHRALHFGGVGVTGVVN